MTNRSSPVSEALHLPTSSASRALATRGRILHNSIGDDCDGTIHSSINNYDKQNLAGAVECLSDLIYVRIEDDAFTVAQIENLKPETIHD